MSYRQSGAGMQLPWARRSLDRVHGTGAASSRWNRFPSQLPRANVAMPRLEELLPKESLLAPASFSLQTHPGKHPAPDLASASPAQPGIKPGPGWQRETIPGAVHQGCHGAGGWR